MNKTKIIATIGPASEGYEMIKKIIIAGVDVIRFNMSYSNYEFVMEQKKHVDKINEELKTNVAVLLDTNGPEVKIGEISTGKTKLIEGKKIRIYMDAVMGDETKFSVNYPRLIDDVKYNNSILMNDGRIELRVIDKELEYIICEVINGGEIESGEGISIPEIKLNLPFVSTKDKDDIMFANKIGADFMALSFVRSAEDVLEVNDILIELGNDHIGIIAKIEKESAVREIDEIIKVSDGIMIARGDLGIEVPMERIPGIQKSIINKCHLMGKISIVATEFLTTMESTTKPTRAEVSDVANAVLESVDAVMLSGETTIGNYPVETVIMMDKIIGSAEEDINYYEMLDKAMKSEKHDTTGSLVYSVTECANRLKCKAIITPTMSGYTARKMSRFRPKCPVIAVTPNIETAKSLSLHFSVRPVLINELNTFEKIIHVSNEVTKELLEIEKGDKIIITGGYPFEDVKHTNFMKIEEL
jgi:pyruvate kinase